MNKEFASVGMVIAGAAMAGTVALGVMAYQAIAALPTPIIAAGGLALAAAAGMKGYEKFEELKVRFAKAKGVAQEYRDILTREGASLPEGRSEKALMSDLRSLARDQLSRVGDKGYETSTLYEQSLTGEGISRAVKKFHWDTYTDIVPSETIGALLAAKTNNIYKEFIASTERANLNYTAETQNPARDLPKPV